MSRQPWVVIVTLLLLCSCDEGRSPVGPSSSSSPSPSPSPSPTASPTASATIEFLGSDPGPEAINPARSDQDSALALTPTLSFRVDVEDAHLKIELLDARGRVCADHDWTWFPGHWKEIVDIQGFRIRYAACPFPWDGPTLVTTTIRAKLSTVRYFPLLEATFPARIEFSFPGTPLSSRPVPPRIVDFTASIFCDYNGPLAPYSLAIAAHCEVADDDADELTLTLAFNDSRGCSVREGCWSAPERIPARPVNMKVFTAIQHSAPTPPVEGTVTCTATDSYGHVARESLPVVRDTTPCPRSGQ